MQGIKNLAEAWQCVWHNATLFITPNSTNGSSSKLDQKESSESNGLDSKQDQAGKQMGEGLGHESSTQEPYSLATFQKAVRRLAQSRLADTFEEAWRGK